MAESDSVPHFPPHASPAQKQHGDTKQTEDRELRVSGRNDEHSSGGLWLDGVFYDSDSSEHAEDLEGFLFSAGSRGSVDGNVSSGGSDRGGGGVGGGGGGGGGPGRSGFAGAHVGAGEGGSGDGDASSEGAAGVIFPGNWDQMTETQRRNWHKRSRKKMS